MEMGNAILSQEPSRNHPMKSKKIHRAWLILIGCCFLQAGGVGAVMVSQGVFYVPVCEDLGFARAEFSLWSSVHSLAGIVFLPIFGKIYAKYNFRVVLTVCVLAVGFAAILMGTYTEMWQFIISGVVYGTFGMGVWLLPYTTLISEWFDKRTGFAMSLPGCASAFAGAVFSPLFTWIISNYGWRTGYFVQGAIVLVFILPWALFVFRLRPRDVGLRPYGASGPERSQEEVAEATKPNTARVIGKLLSPAFLCLFLFIGVSSMLGSGYDSHLPGIGMSYGMSAATAALLVSTLQVGSFVAKLVTGVANDYIGVKKTTYIEIVVIALSLIGIIASQGTNVIFVAVFFFGTQDILGGISAPLILRDIFGKEDYVQLNGWMRSSFSLFGAFAVPAVGLAYDLTGMYTLALVGGIVCSAAALLLVFLAYKFAGQRRTVR